jgi:restriction system protein
VKFQMAKNSLFAVLLRSPWWVSLCVAAVLALLAMALLPAAYRSVGALGALPFVVISVIAGFRQARLPSEARVLATQQAVGAMAWPEFARLLEQAFTRDGYAVQRGTLDGVVDFELERQGRRMLVCARRWKSARTGLEVLRALQSAREEIGVPDALCISLGDLTDTARPYAVQHAIAIWRLDEIALALRGLALPRGALAKAAR